MSVGPPTKSVSAGYTHALNPKGSQSSSLKLKDPEIETAAKMRKEAQDQAQLAMKSAEETERLARDRLDYVRTEYGKLEEVEAIKAEENYAIQRQKGYEALLELKRQQNKELSQTKNLGEKSTRELKDHYDTEGRRTIDDGEANLKQQRNLFAQLSAYEKQQQNQAKGLSGNTVDYETAQAKEIHEMRMTQMTESQRRELEKNRLAMTSANLTAKERFEQEHADTAKMRDEVLYNLNSRVAERIHDIKKDSLVKLMAYEDRNRDPFYQMVDIGADLSENAQEYVLRAMIPTHEQDKVSVFVKGNELVVSGMRRNDDSVSDDGITKRTSSFQTFTQIFPISGGVDSKRLSKSFEGDELTVRVPKLQGRAAQTEIKRKVEKAKLERPEFPSNLPKGDTDIDPGTEPVIEEKLAQYQPKPGSKPLSNT